VDHLEPLPSRYARRRDLSLQSLPSICWVPLALLWFGLSGDGNYIRDCDGFHAAVTQATKAGFRQRGPAFCPWRQELGAKGPAIILHVLLPATLPYLVDGLKQGWHSRGVSLNSG